MSLLYFFDYFFNEQFAFGKDMRIGKKGSNKNNLLFL